MSRFAAGIVLVVMGSMLWLGVAFAELHDRQRTDQDILVHAALPICAAPHAGEPQDEQVEHPDTKEIA